MYSLHIIRIVCIICTNTYIPVTLKSRTMCMVCINNVYESCVICIIHIVPSEFSVTGVYVLIAHCTYNIYNMYEYTLVTNAV